MDDTVVDTESDGLCGEATRNGSINSDRTCKPVEVVPYISRWRSVLSEVTVEPVLALAFLARSMTVGAVLTNLLLYRTCTIDLQYNETACSVLGADTEAGHAMEALIEPHTTLYVMGNTLIGAVPPALMSLFLGPWSDLNGRKPLILLSVAGSAITYLMLAIISYMPWVPPAYVLVAAIPSSLSGGLVTLISATLCYISDVTQEADRAVRMSIVDGSLFAGLLVGLVSSSYIYTAGGEFGYLIIFGSGTLIMVLTFLYTLHWLPETIPRTEGSRGLKGLADVSMLRDLVRTCFKKRERRRRTVILLTMVALALAILTMEGEANVSFLFTRIRFGWSLQKFTLWASVHLAITIVGTVAGVVVLSKMLRVSDSVIGVVAFAMKAGECTLYALLPSGSAALMYLGPVLGVLGGATGPVCRSILSKSVPSQDQGKVFSLTGSLESLAPIAASPLYTVLYASTMTVLPGAFYFLSAVIFLINVLFLGIVTAIQWRLPDVAFESLQTNT